MIRLTLATAIVALSLNAFASEPAKTATQPAVKPAAAAAPVAAPVAATTKVAAKTKEECMKLNGAEQAECMKHLDGAHKDGAKH